MILPDKNEKDLEDVTDSVKESLTFHFVAEVDQVLDLAFGAALRQRAADLQSAQPERETASLPAEEADPEGDSAPVEARL